MPQTQYPSMRNGLTRDNLHGVWMAIHTPFDHAGRIDFDVLRENIRRCHAAGLHGIYTTDSDGEFYALEIDEFKALADVFADECGRLNFPSMMGVTWVNTSGIIERIQYAAAQGVMGAHVGLPFWMPLNRASFQRFWEDVSAAAHDQFALVHYNTPRQHHVLSGQDYAHLAERFPNLVGSKYVQTEADGFINAVVQAPDLAFFVGEPVLAPFFILGARGCNSWMAGFNPAFMLTWWDDLVNHRWDAALEKNKRLLAFSQEALGYLRDDGNFHGIVTKALSTASPFLVHRNRDTRLPYLPVSGEAFDAFKRTVNDQFPDLIYRN